MNVKVYNLNIYDFKQKYKGDIVLIEAGGFIEMDYEEAVMFLGKSSPMIKMKSGQQDPKSFKKLKIDEEDKLKAKAIIEGRQETSIEKVFVCHACSKEFRTSNGLLKHVKDKHQAQLEKDARDELLDNEDLD